MKKILVSLLVNVGDVIMMTAALDLIQKIYPEAKIDVLARPEARDILKHNPLVNQLIIYPYRSGSPFYGLKALVRQLKKTKYDFFLSLDRRPRGVIAAFLAGIKKRVGPRRLYEGSQPKFWQKILLTAQVDLTEEECRGDQTEMFQLVARRAFDFDGQGRITLPPVSADKAAWAENLLKGAAGAPVVGFCVKTNDPSKTWPAENFAGLMTRLKKDFGAFIYVTGAPDDRPYIESLLTMTGLAEKPLNLAGKISFFDIAALAPRSALFISPDNGTGHLAANSGPQSMICILVSTTPEKITESMRKAVFFSFPAHLEKGSDSGAQEVNDVYQAAQKALQQFIQTAAKN